MKYLLVYLISFIFLFGIEFQENYKEALGKAKKDNKFLLVILNDKDCPYCKKLKNETLNDSAVVDFINKNFVMVFVNIYKRDYPKDKLSSILSPATYFLSKNEVKIHRPVIGFMTKDEYLKELKEVAE